MDRNGLAGAFASRKAWAVAVASIAGVLVQMIGFWGQAQQWPQAVIDRWVFVVNCSSLLVFLAGMFVAWLWHRESWARDWGVTEISPAELELRAKVLEGFKDRLPPEVLKVLAQAQSGRRLQVD